MRSEADCPLDEQVLFVEGALTEAAFQEIRRGLPQEATAENCFFVQYAYADLPLPKSFEVAFSRQDPARMQLARATIHAATQQLAEPWPTIQHGWKTICWLGNDEPLPSFLRKLPRVSCWFENLATIGLASQAAWEAFRIRPPRLREFD